MAVGAEELRAARSRRRDVRPGPSVRGNWDIPRDDGAPAMGGTMTTVSSGVPATDAAIPQLRRLTCLPEAARLLDAVLRGQPRPWLARDEGPLDVQAVTVLRGHPGSRWTLRYTVRRGDETRALIAKVYARDRSDVLAALTALRRLGFGPGQPMQVAAPLAYAPALRLLLLEEVPGETARAAVLRGQTGVGERTARWLAAFHAAAPPLPTVYRLHDPLIKARRWTRALSTTAPALAGDARHLCAALVKARPAWPAPPHLAHGDFSASHVYPAAETTTVIDWDAWGVGDRAEDAGRFLASLHHLAARDPTRHGVVAQETEAFARTYQAAVPLAGRSLPFYEALACLRTATRLMADGSPRRERRAAALLTAGEQTLIGGHV